MFLARMAHSHATDLYRPQGAQDIDSSWGMQGSNDKVRRRGRKQPTPDGASRQQRNHPFFILLGERALQSVAYMDEHCFLFDLFHICCHNSRTRIKKDSYVLKGKTKKT